MLNGYKHLMINIIFAFFFILFFSCSWADLPQTIIKIKPSIVGVGTVLPTRQPPGRLMGTGFVVGNGQFIVTNAHVIPDIVGVENNEFLAVFVGIGRQAETREAKLVQTDEEHDLALLKVGGKKIPAMTLGRTDEAEEGRLYAFSGFPIGAVLGLYPVTHRGIISVISPIAIPVNTTKTLDVKMIRRLRNPYNVFQLDATAYPGNSGSPLYEMDTGRVIGVINKVFIKETKEKVLEKPSGISYAIPVDFVRELLLKENVAF